MLLLADYQINLGNSISTIKNNFFKNIILLENHFITFTEFYNTSTIQNVLYKTSSIIKAQIQEFSNIGIYLNNKEIFLDKINSFYQDKDSSFIEIIDDNYISLLIANENIDNLTEFLQDDERNGGKLKALMQELIQNKKNAETDVLNEEDIGILQKTVDFGSLDNDKHSYTSSVIENLESERQSNITDTQEDWNSYINSTFQSSKIATDIQQNNINIFENFKSITNEVENISNTVSNYITTQDYVTNGKQIHKNKIKEQIQSIPNTSINNTINNKIDENLLSNLNLDNNLVSISADDIKNSFNTFIDDEANTIKEDVISKRKTDLINEINEGDWTTNSNVTFSFEKENIFDAGEYTGELDLKNTSINGLNNNIFPYTKDWSKDTTYILDQFVYKAQEIHSRELQSLQSGGNTTFSTSSSVSFLLWSTENTNQHFQLTVKEDGSYMILMKF